MAGDILKRPNIGSILIPRFEDFDEVIVVHQLLTTIEILHHESYFILNELLYLITLLGVLLIFKNV